MCQYALPNGIEINTIATTPRHFLHARLVKDAHAFQRRVAALPQLRSEPVPSIAQQHHPVPYEVRSLHRSAQAVEAPPQALLRNDRHPLLGMIRMARFVSR